MKTMMIFDLETSLDVEAVCTGFRLPSKDLELVREAAGDFAKLPFHKIISIGYLATSFIDGAWSVTEFDCDHAGTWSEVEMLKRFDDRLLQFKANLVGFGTHTFDIPLLRYRAMMAKIAMPALASRKYFSRFTDDAEDLCDFLSSYDARGKISLDVLSRVLGYAGKPEDVDGSRLGPLIEQRDFSKIASYCAQDVLLTYAIWLRHRRFAGLSVAAYNESLRRLHVFLEENRPELAHVIQF